MLKLAAGLAVLYVLLGLLMFWPIVFHAETTVRVLRTGSTSVHVAWLEPAGDAACFLAIKL